MSYLLDFLNTSTGWPGSCCRAAMLWRTGAMYYEVEITTPGFGAKLSQRTGSRTAAQGWTQVCRDDPGACCRARLDEDVTAYTPQKLSGSHAGLPVGSLQALTRFRSSPTLLPHLFFPELWTIKPSRNTVLTRTPMISDSAHRMSRGTSCSVSGHGFIGCGKTHFSEGYGLHF